ncbi:MAG: cupin domain-containing protein [Bacillota bacterium]
MKWQSVNVLTKLHVQDSGVNKVANMKTDQIGADTYYFSPGQVLAYHQHPESDQLFIVLQGNGKFYLDDGTEEAFDVGPGSIILAPRGVWHQLVNTEETPLVASQVTRLPVSSVSR